MNSLVNKAVLHGIRYCIDRLLRKPIISIPGVGKSDFVACFLSKFIVVIDEDITFLDFCIPLIRSIYPHQARKSLFYYVDILRLETVSLLMISLCGELLAKDKEKAKSKGNYK